MSPQLTTTRANCFTQIPDQGSRTYKNCNWFADNNSIAIKPLLSSLSGYLAGNVDNFDFILTDNKKTSLWVFFQTFTNPYVALLLAIDIPKQRSFIRDNIGNYP
jgi:hypothetical protein